MAVQKEDAFSGSVLYNKSKKGISMQMRTIISFFALLVFLTVAVGGGVYFHSVEETLRNDVLGDVNDDLQDFAKRIAIPLSEYQKISAAVAGLKELPAALMMKNPDTIRQANVILDHFQYTIQADACFLMDQAGDTISSSNRNTPQSFVGKNYAFRPYFQDAISGTSAIYPAIGVVTKKRGLFYSYPVYGGDREQPLGVLVIKSSTDPIEKEIYVRHKGIMLLADPHGIVFISNRPEWLYHSLWRIPGEELSVITATQQFGEGPIEWIGMEKKDDHEAIDSKGKKYIIYQKEIAGLPGWTASYLLDSKILSREISVGFFRKFGPFLVVFCVVIGLAGLFLYRKADQEIRRRKLADEAQKQSLSLLQATLESTADGILVVNSTGEITSFNARFAELWRLPDDILSSRDDRRALDFALDQLRDPQGFLDKVEALYAHPEEESFDVLEFKDGRTFERYSRPQRMQDRIVGRVWSFRDVTERKKAEQAIILAKEEWEMTFDASADPIMIIGTDYHIKRLNKAMAEMIGCSVEDAVGKLCYEQVHNITEHMQACPHAKLLEDQQTYTEEIYEPLLDKYLLVTVSPLFDSGGSLYGSVHYAKDITDRKQAEIALRSSESMLQAIIDAEPECVKLLDADGRVLMMNQAGLAMIEADSLEQVKGQIVCPLITSEYRQSFVELIDRVFRGESGTLEFEVVARKGGHLWLETHAVPFRNDKEEIIALLGVTRNITERKHAQEALRQSEEFLRNTLDNVDEGFLVVDRDLTIQLANKTYSKWVGLSIGDIIGSKCYEITHKVFTPCYETGVACAVRAAFDTGMPQRTVHDHTDEDGKKMYIEIKTFPVRDASGQVTFVIETLSNITEKYLLEEERVKTQKLAAIGTLAGGIAHDFNNLLQGIFGYISVAKMSIDQKEKSLAMLEQAEEALHLSVNLTTQLLTFSKGGKPLKKLIRIGAAVENAVKFSLSGSHTNYTMDIPADLRSVEADAGQVAQVIQNIVLNANDAMAGSGTVHVSLANVDIAKDSIVSLPNGGQFVCLVIQDSGIGIPEQNLPRIFDPYFTTKQKGSGLGLATSYSIIKNHGGMIEVKSELNKGTTFTIYLPASGSAEMEAATATSHAVGTMKGRILLMDDEDLVRKVAQAMVTALGHDVVSAEDGKKAVELFRRAREAGTPFDLVILDLTVKGGMGGEEAIRKIREIDPDVTAVVSSGYADSPVVADYRTYGFSAVLNKPYTIDAINDMLESLLAN
ncbi:MAG: PAS domain-containing protein [Thermodesulfovibrionales bacterium]